MDASRASEFSTMSQRGNKDSLFSSTKNIQARRANSFRRMPYGPNSMKRGRNDSFASPEEGRSSDSENYGDNEYRFLNGGGITHGHALILGSSPFSHHEDQSFSTFSYHFGAWDQLPDFEFGHETTPRYTTPRMQMAGSPSSSLSSSLGDLSIDTYTGSSDCENPYLYSDDDYSMHDYYETTTPHSASPSSMTFGGYQVPLNYQSYTKNPFDKENKTPSVPLQAMPPSNLKTQMPPPLSGMFNSPSTSSASSSSLGLGISPSKKVRPVSESFHKQPMKRLASANTWPVLTPTIVPDTSNVDQVTKKRRFASSPLLPSATFTSKSQSQVSPCMGKEKRKRSTYPRKLQSIKANTMKLRRQ